MPYTGPEPARRPLSSDDITDGIVSTADLADSAVTAGAKTLVASFWMKSPKSGTHCVSLDQPDGGSTYIREFTVASADTWEKHTVTFPGDASGTINNDTGAGLELKFPLFMGSTYQGTADTWTGSGTQWATSNQQNLLDNTANNFYITGVQLEVGSVATDFEHEDYGTTLAKCQRYFERLDYNGASAESIGVGTAASTSSVICVIPYRRKKRALPTLTASAAATFEVIYAGGAVADIGTINSLAAGIEAITFVGTGVVGSPLTDGYSVNLRRDGTDTTYIDISAEL
jgi:hypothetical protein